jgi:hypothetical protein
MNAKCGIDHLHKMADTTCVVCDVASDKQLCYECMSEEFLRLHVCTACSCPCAENDCGGYFLCNVCVGELDEFWEDESDDESEPTSSPRALQQDHCQQHQTASCQAH